MFSGHMIDGPDRSPPRFPADDVPGVERAIKAVIGSIDDASAEAFSGAACGGDLLFCQAWLDTRRRLTVFLPRATESFLDESVRFAGPQWIAAFEAVIDHANTTVVGPEPGMDELEDPHSPNNLRMLEYAVRRPPLHGIFVWDGAGGDGPGGTKQMVAAVREAGGEVTIIDP